MDIETKEINSLEEFIQKVKPLLQIENTKDITLFRGTREYQLLSTGAYDRNMNLTLSPMIENVKIQKRRTRLETEERMFSTFKKRVIPYLSYIPRNEYEWLALARHYGLPTRLLDWTSNPLAALWFAINQEWVDNEYAIIWVFKTIPSDHLSDAVLKKNKPFELSSTKVFQPADINNRITAQSAWFTIHKHQDEKKKFLQVSKIKKFKSNLMRLKISNKDAAVEIRELLTGLGINSASLFPDIDGLCRQITWDNTLMKDESDGNVEADKESYEFPIFN